MPIFNVAEFNAIKQMEQQIVRKLIETALRNGCTVKLNDGESIVATVYALTPDDVEEQTQTMMKEINATDEEYLIFDLNGSRVGTVFLVYGNTGYDVICDYVSRSGAMDIILGEANRLADELESKFNAEFNHA